MRRNVPWEEKTLSKEEILATGQNIYKFIRKISFYQEEK
jgi:hypothetical protein